MSGSPTLGEISDVAANAAWTNEVAFSGWLAAHLDRLSDILDVGDLRIGGNRTRGRRIPL
jgi:hypothetical protein